MDGSGLTLFCPIDQAMEAFTPKFDKLTAAQRASVLLYHGIPAYESMDMLRSSNGVRRTLATQGKSKGYNLTVQNAREVVTLKTRVTTASVTGTLVDEDPLAVYTIDEVLEPRELFRPEKAARAPAPAAAPVAAADAPKAAKKKKKKDDKEKETHVTPPAPAPAGPEEQPADDKAADENNAGQRSACLQRRVAVLVAAVAVVMLA